jgi:hypothetical protein
MFSLLVAFTETHLNGSCRSCAEEKPRANGRNAEKSVPEHVISKTDLIHIYASTLLLIVGLALFSGFESFCRLWSLAFFSWETKLFARISRKF